MSLASEGDVPRSPCIVFRLLQVVPQYPVLSNGRTGSGFGGDQGYQCRGQRALRESEDSSGVEKAWFKDKPEHYCQNHAEEQYEGEVFQKIPLHHRL